MTQIKDLPSPYKELALANQKLQGNEEYESLGLSFSWSKSPEGFNFWRDVSQGRRPTLSAFITKNYPDLFPENKEVLVEDTASNKYCSCGDPYCTMYNPNVTKGKEVKEESDLIPFVMYLTGYKEEQAVRVYENWKRNVKNQLTNI